MNNKHLIILGILLLVLIGGGIYYFKQKDSEENKIIDDKTVNKNPVVMGDSTNSSVQGTNLTSGENSTSDSKIISGEAYVSIITDIRKPINDGFDDLNSKIKYKTLFSEEDVQKAIENLEKNIADVTVKIKNLPIDSKFNEANKKELESLTLLTEAMDAFKKLYSATSQEEQTKYNDIYSYKIDQSNNILKNIAIPK